MMKGKHEPCWKTNESTVPFKKFLNGILFLFQLFKDTLLVFSAVWLFAIDAIAQKNQKTVKLIELEGKKQQEKTMYI